MRFENTNTVIQQFPTIHWDTVVDVISNNVNLKLRVDPFFHSNSDSMESPLNGCRVCTYDNESFYLSLAFSLESTSRIMYLSTVLSTATVNLQNIPAAYPIPIKQMLTVRSVYLTLSLSFQPGGMGEISAPCSFK